MLQTSNATQKKPVATHNGGTNRTPLGKRRHTATLNEQLRKRYQSCTNVWLTRFLVVFILLHFFLNLSRIAGSPSGKNMNMSMPLACPCLVCTLFCPSPRPQANQWQVQLSLTAPFENLETRCIRNGCRDKFRVHTN